MWEGTAGMWGPLPTLHGFQNGLQGCGVREVEYKEQELIVLGGLREAAVGARPLAPAERWP